MENEAVEQELIINSTNPMVDGNGQEAVAASAAVISESTSVGLDYIANNLNIQHHETCPSVAADVLDDVEENIIEPDVILPATLMSGDDSSPGPPPPQLEHDHQMSCDAGGPLTPTTSMSGGCVHNGAVFMNGGSGGSSAGSKGSGGGGGGKSSRGAAHRTRRTLRRYGGPNGSGKDNVNRNNSNGCQAMNLSQLGPGNNFNGNGLKAATAYDEFMAFGVTVAAKLSKMSTYQRLYAENIINQTLFRGMLNQLQPPPPSPPDETSFLYVQPPPSSLSLHHQQHLQQHDVHMSPEATQSPLLLATMTMASPPLATPTTTTATLATSHLSNNNNNHNNHTAAAAAATTTTIKRETPS